MFPRESSDRAHEGYSASSYATGTDWRIEAPLESSLGSRRVCNPGVIRMPDDTIGIVYSSFGNDSVGRLGFCRLDKDGRRIIPHTRDRQPLEIVFSRKQQGFPDGYGAPGCPG